MSFIDTTLVANCRDKIEILDSLKSDIHSQVVTTMLTDNKELALALLVSFETKITAILTSTFSLHQINIVYRSLTRQGRLLQIAKQRQQALLHFYQEISPAEFAYSPLGLRLNDPSWLTNLDSAEIIQLTLAIEDDLLAVFLSCLAPLRVSKIINNTKQKRIIDALQATSFVNEADLDRLLSFLDQHHNQLINQQNKTANYLSEVINNLDKSNREQLLDNLTDKSQLQNSSFTTISQLPTKQITEIFIDCPALQIAQTLLDCNILTQNAVLEALPETTRLGVSDQLTKLQMDREHQAKHLHISRQLQQAINGYLQASK